jgi:phosphoenolpyruvate carboxylase
VYRRVEAAFGRVYPGSERPVPAFLQFGSWIGGERDGHPNVTHDVTADAVRLQQETILRHDLGRIDDLGRHLSHSDYFATIGPYLRASIDADRPLFPELMSVRDPDDWSPARAGSTCAVRCTAGGRSGPPSSTTPR